MLPVTNSPAVPALAQRLVQTRYLPNRPTALIQLLPVRPAVLRQQLKPAGHVTPVTLNPVIPALRNVFRCRVKPVVHMEQNPVLTVVAEPGTVANLRRLILVPVSVALRENFVRWDANPITAVVVHMSVLNVSHFSTAARFGAIPIIMNTLSLVLMLLEDTYAIMEIPSHTIVLLKAALVLLAVFKK